MEEGDHAANGIVSMIFYGLIKKEGGRFLDNAIQYGLFDWIDRSPATVGELYEERLKLVEIADQSGFYGYHLAEHHGTKLGIAPSPSLFFSALAQRTQSIRFSAMAFLLPMYHPIRLIEEVCMLDHLSDGRVELGVSRGVSPYELKCFDVDPTTAQDVFIEALEIFKKGMTEAVLNYSGEHFNFKDVSISLKPLQQPHPPLWYPTFSESGTVYAAKNGYNFLTLGPSALAAKLALLYRDEHNQTLAGGKSISAPKIGAMRQIFIASTDKEALTVAEHAYRDWYESVTELWHKNDDSSFDAIFGWEECLSSETILIGSVDTVCGKIQDLVNQSQINYLAGSFAWGSLSFEQSKSSLMSFVNDVAPNITPSRLG
jgi:alkanesulfonate monooxygenase SsuD/methylene tetrahydromethanopterin reductase-like flavin-dependent oxidoreductase (luciferase family)